MARDRSIDFTDLEELPGDNGRLFERLRRPPRPQLPVSAVRKRARASRETAASARARQRVSQQVSGIHHRRLRKVR